MVRVHNEFCALAERVERGDPAAAPELRRLMEGAMGPVVRRALRGGGTSALAERVRAVAVRAGGPGALAGEVGASLAARAVGRLRAGAGSVPAGCETVVA